MFEVGKEYVKADGDIVECVFVGRSRAVLREIGGIIEYCPDFCTYHNWKEYKEPRTITRWVNVYDTGDELVFGNMWTDEERAIRHGRTAEWGENKYIATFPISYTEPL